MALDLDQRFAARFPSPARRLAARAMAMPEDSPTRRRALRHSFRIHGETSHPSAGAYRTPEEHFGGLPDFPWTPTYRQIGDLRLAHLDVGEGPPVVMIHGEPTWSFIWRKVIPPIQNAGYRCVAADNAGFGRSDKPLDESWYIFERQVELTSSLLEDLDLRDVTLVVHDFGGPIGLTVAQVHPDRISRIVILNTVFDLDEVWMNEAWIRMRDFIFHTEDLAIGEVVQANSIRQLPDEVLKAYEAPFPVPESKAGVIGLEQNIPEADDSGTKAFSDAWFEVLRRDSRPMLVIWGQHDLILTLASGHRLTSRIGREIDHVIPDAGHALQEDQGPEVGRLIADWLAASESP